MKEWIEVFRTGKHTDSQGRERNWTKADLDKMVTSYDPADHEAPVVVGHPKSNAPAYGWTESLKRVGELLLAKFKQVEPDFAELVEKGRFKKRSISVYPDGRLRHVGFLGASPPAIAGLKDIDFSAEDDCHDYEQPIQQENDDMTKEEFEKKLAEEKAKTAAAKKEAAEFKAQAQKSGADFAEAQKAAQQKSIADFIAAGIKDGKLLPVWKEQGLAEFMSALEENETEYQFSEGKKQSPADFFRNFLESFSAHPLFKDMVKPADEKKQQDVEFEEEEKLAQEMADIVNPGE